MDKIKSLSTFFFLVCKAISLTYALGMQQFFKYISNLFKPHIQMLCAIIAKCAKQSVSMSWQQPHY